MNDGVNLAFTEEFFSALSDMTGESSAVSGGVVGIGTFIFANFPTFTVQANAESSVFSFAVMTGRAVAV